MSNASVLFKPLRCGNMDLQHRLVLAPLTRMRCPKHVPISDMAAEYYAQRSSPGSLAITEATLISAEAGGYPTVPGIWSQEQIDAWKAVPKAVHEKKGYIFMQLWAMGRANVGGDKETTPRKVSSGNKGLDGAKVEALSTEEARTYIKNYGQAAKNAIEAGFDGVELHAANGYLPHQFIDGICNNVRQDEYGGSLENRARFTLDALEAITQAIGQARTGIRFSPYGTYQETGQEPIEIWLYMLRQIKERFPKMAYVHMTEDGEAWRGVDISESKIRSLDVFREVLQPSSGEAGEFEEAQDGGPTFITCSDFRRDTAIKIADTKKGLIAVGRRYISTPDLPERWRQGHPDSQYDRKTFYSQGPVGYTDYATYGNVGHAEKLFNKAAKI